MGIWSRSAETKNPRKNCIWCGRSSLRSYCGHIGLLTGSASKFWECKVSVKFQIFDEKNAKGLDFGKIRRTAASVAPLTCKLTCKV